MRALILFLVTLTSFSCHSLWADEVKDIPEGVIAMRGDGTVSKQMFDARMSKIPTKDRTGVLASTQRLESILADLVLISQLIADAEKADYDKDEAIQARMQFAAESELANAWLQHYVESQPAADYAAMANEYYQLNKSEFETKPSRDVTHLLVSNKQRSMEEAEELALSFLEQTMLDPSSFDQLVVDNSEDSSVFSNKGHFMAVKRGDMVKSFEEALFSLKTPGDFSGLVTTQYGIHIIRLDGINPVRIRDFEEVRDQLETIQENLHRERIQVAYLNGLVSKEVQISQEEVEAMVKRYFGEQEPQEHTEAPKSE